MIGDDLPDVVMRAESVARSLGFEASCTQETGRLLRVLVGTVRDGVVGEIGTGAGVGTAWMASGLGEDAHLVSIEHDEARVEAARELFKDDRRVRILHGEWHQLLTEGPFKLLFVDVGAAKREPEAVIPALAHGGVIVLDDFTPEDLWPGEWRGKPDVVREAWMKDPRLASTLVQVTRRMQVILASRL